MIQEIRLKNYQKKALHEININYANGIKSQLLIMATGTGKTVVFCEFIKELISVNKKVLVLVHRDELINQAERRLKLHTNEPFGIEKAERKANNENIVLASVQTLKGKRLKKFAKDYFDAIIIDECHRSTANSYMTVRKHFNKSHVLGVTATPERQDDLKITKRHFQKIAFTYNILDAIKEGNLSNIKVWRVESEQDISGVKSNSDDLDQKELAKILDNKEYIEFIHKTIQEKANNKKIMVFMPSVKLSDKLCDFLNSKGIQSFSVSSNTPLEKRQEVLDDYRTGKIQVLSNYNIFTEGFDEPSIDCVIMARPTKSLIFYSQALGRMTRLFHGKEYGMFIDIGFINSNHKIASVFDLVEKNEETPIEIDNKLNSILKKYEGGIELSKCLDEYKINSQKLLKEYKKELAKQAKQQEQLKLKQKLSKEKYKNRLINNQWRREYHLKEISLDTFFKDIKYISDNNNFFNSNKKIIEKKLLNIFKNSKHNIFDFKGRSALDSDRAKKIYNLVVRLSEENKYLMLSSHGFSGKTLLYINNGRHKRILLPSNKKGIQVFYNAKNFPYLLNQTNHFFIDNIKKYSNRIIEDIKDERKLPRWAITINDKIRWTNIINRRINNWKSELIKYQEMFEHWKKEKIIIQDGKNLEGLFKKYKIS